jgi:hypothetical protein
MKGSERMRVGDKKLFILMPFEGLIEAGKTLGETIDRINKVRMENEKIGNRCLEELFRYRLEKENPNCEIIQKGDEWFIIPKDKE